MNIETTLPPAEELGKDIQSSPEVQMAFAQGRADFSRGVERSQNPYYERQVARREAWFEGWDLEAAAQHQE